MRVQLLSYAMSVLAAAVLCGRAAAQVKSGEGGDPRKQVVQPDGAALAPTAGAKPALPAPKPPFAPEGGIAGGPPNDDCANALVIGNGTTNFDTTGASTDGNPDPLCLNFGDDQVTADIWYRYTATCTGTLQVSLCGSTYDTRLAVYANQACPPSNPLACNDDSCGTQSEVNAFVTSGSQYLIRIGGWQGDTGPGTVTISCVAGPANDNCANAQNVGEGTFEWDNTLATGVGPRPCGQIDADLWYRYTPSGTGNARVTTCFMTAVDTVISVYSACGGSNIVCVDDFCGTQTQVTFPVTGGTPVLIQLGGFAGERGSGQFTIELTGPCTAVVCPPGALAEPEPCGQNANGGCNSTPVATTALTCGQAVCGTAWAVGGTRDTDWYEFTVCTQSDVTWEVSAEFPAAIFIMTAACPPTIMASGAVEACSTSSIGVNLPPGRYYAFVATGTFSGGLFEGYPCGFENTYWGRITYNCGQSGIGRCCLPNGTCVDTNAAGCSQQGGVFTICDSCANACTPANDLCTNAIDAAVPSSTTGTTAGATSDANAIFCGTSVSAPGVWYRVTGDGTTLTATTCAFGTLYDTKLNVYCGTCNELRCVGGNDDDANCGGAGLESTVTWCSQQGATYYILVQGFGGATGQFELLLSSDGAGCQPAVQCLAAGACCLANNNCVVTSPADCAGRGGQYAGNDVPCQQLVGGAIWESADTPVAIPDAPGGPAQSAILVDEANLIEENEIQIGMIIEHTYQGDLSAEVVSPLGTVVRLINRPGAPPGTFGFSADNFGNPTTGEKFILAQDATQGPYDVPAVPAPGIDSVSGKWRPDNGDLNAFVGQQKSGTWTLRVRDNAAQDLGRIVSWCIIKKGVPTPTCPLCDELRGDSDGTGAVNNFDIDAFVLALSQPAAYTAQYCGGDTGCYICRNDLNGDDRVNNFDIDAFVACLNNVPPPGEPCP